MTNNEAIQILKSIRADYCMTAGQLHGKVAANGSTELFRVLEADTAETLAAKFAAAKTALAARGKRSARVRRGFRDIG